MKTSFNYECENNVSNGFRYISFIKDEAQKKKFVNTEYPMRSTARVRPAAHVFQLVFFIIIKIHKYIASSPQKS